MREKWSASALTSRLVKSRREGRDRNKKGDVLRNDLKKKKAKKLPREKKKRGPELTSHDNGED